MTDHRTEDCYVQNPDVVLREEEPEGGLLFNPDTDQIKVLNTTGLFIWKYCGTARNMAGIVTAVKSAFDEVPEEAAENEITDFVADMTATGFMGTEAT